MIVLKREEDGNGMENNVLKYKNKILFGIVFCLVLLTLNFASGKIEPDFTAENGINYNITIPCDVGGYFCPATVTCNVSLQHISSSSFILENQEQPIVGNFIRIELNTTQTTTNGYYLGDVKCQNSATGVNDSDGFYLYISQNGELPEIPKAIFYVGLLIVLIVIQVIVFWAHMGDKAFIWKFWWFSMTWVLMIGISFTAWRMSQDFLTSSGFLVSMFYIIFLVLLLTFVPFILVLILWTFMMLFIWLFMILPLEKRGLNSDDAWAYLEQRNKNKFLGKLINLADLFSREKER